MQLKAHFLGLTALVALLAVGVSIALARPLGQNGAPALISYQGYLAAQDGTPVADGDYPLKFAIYDAETGGVKIWEETQNSVNVAGGFFSVLLGNGSCSTGCPLGASTFAGATRYLQVSLDLGSGFVDFPRQPLVSVPYALQAQVAANAPWNGLTGLPAGFADNTDDVDDLVSYDEISATVGTGNQQVAAGNHAHNALYYTEIELQTSGSASVHWDNLSNVPPDLADGIDDVDDIVSYDEISGTIGTGPQQVAAGNHAHNNLYYTETELQTGGSANVHWDNLSNVPPDLVDGTDDVDDTVSYDEISGIVGTGNQEVAAGDHLHDDRYYTETELQTSGSANVHWNNLSSVPPGFADGTDDGASYENVIVVAKSGGDYTSVKDALDQTTGAGQNNRYLVLVGPGVFTETDLLQVRGYVHLKGYGPNVTLIKSLRSAATQGPDAATVQLDDNGRISNAQINNEGTGSTYGIGIYSATPASREAVIDNVVVQANGSGGVAHYALYLNDAEPTIKDSWLQATGASTVNSALGSVNIAAGFPQALILNSYLIGGNDNGITCADNTGTGFGLQMTNSSPTIRDSYICGGHRGIVAGVNGNVQLQHSLVNVSSTAGAFLFEATASGSLLVANSGVFYVGNKFTGTGSLVCVGAYKANYTAANATCD